MTDAEQKLWSLLRNRKLLGAKFRRQVPLGLYVADFACLSAKLIVEADGGRHDGNAADAARTQWLSARGFRVLRFWNNAILTDTAGVLATLQEALPCDDGRNVGGPVAQDDHLEPTWEIAR